MLTTLRSATITERGDYEYSKYWNEAIGVSRQSVNELLRERRGLSPEMALRLGRLFGNSPEFWLNAQRAVDLWDASQELENDMAGIQPLDAA